MKIIHELLDICKEHDMDFPKDLQQWEDDVKEWLLEYFN